MEELFVIRCHSAFVGSEYGVRLRSKAVVAEQEQMFEVTVDNSDIEHSVEEESISEAEDTDTDVVDEIIDCGSFRFDKMRNRCIFRERNVQGELQVILGRLCYM